MDLFERDMMALLDGQEVILPKFDFKTGERGLADKKIKIPENGVNYRDKANADSLVGQHIEYAWESLSDSKVPGKPVGLFIRDMIGSESRF